MKKFFLILKHPIKSLMWYVSDIAIRQGKPCSIHSEIDKTITMWEYTYLCLGVCPDCAKDEVYGGPGGFGGQVNENIVCKNCGARFNWCPDMRQFSERLSYGKKLT